MAYLSSHRMFCGVVMLLIQDAIMSRAAIAASSNIATVVTTQCEYYDSTKCTDEQSCAEHKACEPAQLNKRNHCFVLWKMNDTTGNITVSLKGCFLNSEECYNKNECIADGRNKYDYFYCCCEGNDCNRNFTYVPKPTEIPIKQTTKHEPEPKDPMATFWAIFAGLGVVSLASAAVYYLYRKNKHHIFNEWGLPTMEPNPLPPPSPYLGARPIQLLEIKARGRFGAVWKAQLKSEEVAVKIFPVQDKQSWLAEQEIFKLPNMDHPNILHYIGVEKKGEKNLQAEFWLITAYHERGSLCDFLKANTLTWYQLCRIVETMARGLMHLHEEIPSKLGESSKPAIAHRDFKSKNVLLKQDMTACIADFGLALVFVSGKSCGDTHGQVGTRRYMAPEVLEGAINFTPDAFLRIDMYACGLVLWELVSRCTAHSALAANANATTPTAISAMATAPPLPSHNHTITAPPPALPPASAPSLLVALPPSNNHLLQHNNFNNHLNHHHNQHMNGYHNNHLNHHQNNQVASNNASTAALNAVNNMHNQLHQLGTANNNTALVPLPSILTPEYRLPFEEEVGVHPTLEDMQEAVVQRKVRPRIEEHWRNHPGISSLCDTMEECWDHDAEARLSASCVMERVMIQSRYQYSSLGIRLENDSPTKDNSVNM